eukprot:19118-Chlamydomonas_euryale.AAC.4
MRKLAGGRGGHAPRRALSSFKLSEGMSVGERAAAVYSPGRWGTCPELCSLRSAPPLRQARSFWQAPALALCQSGRASCIYGQTRNPDEQHVHRAPSVSSA